MAHSTDIVAYTYVADLYCPECITDVYGPAQGYVTYSYAITHIEAMLDDLASQAGINRGDERSFDSDEFPKVVFRDQVRSGGEDHDGEWDYCGGCGERLN